MSPALICLLCETFCVTCVTAFVRHRHHSQAQRSKEQVKSYSCSPGRFHCNTNFFVQEFVQFTENCRFPIRRR